MIYLNINYACIYVTKNINEKNTIYAFRKKLLSGKILFINKFR